MRRVLPFGFEKVVLQDSPSVTASENTVQTAV